MSHSDGEKGEVLIIVATILRYDPEEKCYCPATLVHCRPLPPPTIDISAAGQTIQRHVPASSAKNAIICLALIISILGMVVQITALSGWWQPWGERVVWKTGRSRWGLTVRPAEGDAAESTGTEDEKTPPPTPY
ncbi:hypothetical protein DSL72_005168 [Monilinia vaccinii-corymbosi]|uniref:Uncharacterized protein n=1 Tax=Monilinia vaccinii-corymbosi TaxID=61207 RepID=A0A8A3PET7_9HELO|nr:hypothetical protein DSL72_005168 [Monilinia vaccinii-corymbosi]